MRPSSAILHYRFEWIHPFADGNGHTGRALALWELYLRLVEVESAFRDLKGDLGLRPIYHSKESRVEAHIFVAFMAYCLHVGPGQQLRRAAWGLGWELPEDAPPRITEDLDLAT